jgi:hypothetical protein
MALYPRNWNASVNVDVQILNKGQSENCSPLVGFQKWNPSGILKRNISVK